MASTYPKPAGKKWQKLCPPCPKCKSKKAVVVMWDKRFTTSKAKLIAVCSHCAIAAELRWSDEIVERGRLMPPTPVGGRSTRK